MCVCSFFIRSDSIRLGWWCADLFGVCDTVCVFFFEYLVSKWRFDVARSKSIWSAISVITFDLIQAISAKLPLRISQPAESL